MVCCVTWWWWWCAVWRDGNGGVLCDAVAMMVLDAMWCAMWRGALCDEVRDVTWCVMWRGTRCDVVRDVTWWWLYDGRALDMTRRKAPCSYTVPLKCISKLSYFEKHINWPGTHFCENFWNFSMLILWQRSIDRKVETCNIFTKVSTGIRNKVSMDIEGINATNFLFSFTIFC